MQIEPWLLDNIVHFRGRLKDRPVSYADCNVRIQVVPPRPITRIAHSSSPPSSNLPVTTLYFEYTIDGWKVTIHDPHKSGTSA